MFGEQFGPPPVPEHTTNLSTRSGTAANYTKIADDGIELVGDATQFRDELGNVTTLKTVGIGVELNTDEGALEFAAAANLSDFVITGVQRNHDAALIAKVFPHIHCWLSQEAVVPNMIVQYRWQENGKAKVTAWTNYKLNTLLFGQPPAGVTNNAILGNTTGIEPPADSFVSPIIQFKLFRDAANASGEFAGADPYSGTFSVTAFDIHIELDAMGSRQQYHK